MKRILIVILASLTLLLLLATGVAAWYMYGKFPVRSGSVAVRGLSGDVSVSYDERGVPHIQAENEADMYRALGYVHAQDRLFQMEIMRRLANGELAEVLGAGQLKSDKLFRTLGLRNFARAQAQAMDRAKPATKALMAYLDGVNQFQASHPPPVEFDLLGIPQRPFTLADSLVINAYLAYSFAATFKTAPLLTYIRDQLGPQYLRAFDTDWYPGGAAQAQLQATTTAASAGNGTRLALNASDWAGLSELQRISQSASEMAGFPQLRGSNAWAVSGQRTASGKPLLAGDPHIGYAVPAIWYEAQISAPGFDLYGDFNSLNPAALLGHNARFGWSLTMLSNADIDLIAEKTNPDNPNQVWYQGQWVDMSSHTETIHVKGASDVFLQLRRTPHGPVISDAVGGSAEKTPISMWWVYQQADNAMPDAFYALNRADTLERARDAASQISAPGLNIVWANAAGDIGWWAAAKIPQRPPGVNPMFILDAARGEAEKSGFYNFTFNPQEENPRRGYVVSANQQPPSAIPIPGFYPMPDRYIEIDRLLSDPKQRWDAQSTKAVQQDVCNGYPKRLLSVLLPLMDQVLTDPNDRAFMEPLNKWDGCYTENSVAATLFTEFSYELARATFGNKLDATQFHNLLGSHILDPALPRLAADTDSPWWNNTTTPQIENRYETLRVAWAATLQHLEQLYGTSLMDWTWGRTHSLTHHHPMSVQWPFDLLFDVGPFYVPGGRETPANFSNPLGPAPWAVTLGPSTRRIIDFADPQRALGINPVGQSGVPFDRHYSDQARKFAEGGYAVMHTAPDDVARHTRSTLTLTPQTTDTAAH